MVKVITLGSSVKYCEKADLIVINKGIIINAMLKMKNVFGEDVVCTLLYHVGKAIGSAIRDENFNRRMMYKSPSLFDGINEVLQEVEKTGFIKSFSIYPESGIVKLVVNHCVDEICAEKSSPYPLLRGLMDGILGSSKSSIVDVRRRGGDAEVLFLISENIKW